MIMLGVGGCLKKKMSVDPSMHLLNVSFTFFVDSFNFLREKHPDKVPWAFKVTTNF